MNPPLEKMISTQSFGEENSSYAQTGHHVGVDLHAEIGTTVYAPEKCTVVNTYSNHPTLGNCLELQGTYTWRYMHLDTMETKQDFNAGDKLGTTGNTGMSTGPHLHIDCRKGNIADATPDNFRDIFIDPMSLFESRYISMYMITPDSWASADEKIQELKDFFQPYYNLDIKVIKKTLNNVPTQESSTSKWIADWYIENEIFPLVVQESFPEADVLCVVHEDQLGTNWGIRRDRIHGVSPIQVFMGEHTSRPVMNSNPPQREPVFVPYIAHEVCHALFDLYDISDPVDGSENGVHWFDYEEQNLKSAVRYVYQNGKPFPKSRVEKLLYATKNDSILKWLYMWIKVLLGKK